MLENLSTNPFAVLSLIAAPAVLTNASSVLALGTSNRFARAVDRQRQLSSLLEREGKALGQEELSLRLKQLRRTELRGQLLLRALTSFYLSLGSFAAASLLSLLGALLGTYSSVFSVVAGLLAAVMGLSGVGGLVFGTTLLVRETRIALESLREEAAYSQSRFSEGQPTGSPI